jgi:hypothetical protein
MSQPTVTSLLEETTADSPGYIEICEKSFFFTSVLVFNLSLEEHWIFLTLSPKILNIFEIKSSFLRQISFKVDVNYYANHKLLFFYEKLLRKSM